MTWWEALGTAYIIGIFGTLCIAALYIQCTSRYDKARGARLVFLAPVWVVPAAAAVYRGIRWLWRTANWKMKL